MSSAWTPSSQPSPHSCSRFRPVKSSHLLLNQVHRLSAPLIQMSTGALSASARNRPSLSRSAGLGAFPRRDVAYDAGEIPAPAHAEFADGQVERKRRPIATQANDLPADADDLGRSTAQIIGQEGVMTRV